MASIKSRTNAAGKKSYTVQIRLKGHAPQTASFERLTDARRWAASIESAIREGRHFKTSEAKRHTLSDLIDRYCTQILPRKKTSTANDNRRHLEWWSAQIGDYPLADVNAALIVEHRDKLEAGTYKRFGAHTPQARNPATCNRYLASLSHAFSIAEREWEWIDDNPCRKITRLKEARGRVRYLSDAERERLLAACEASESSDLYLAVVLALSTGARKMEIMSLRWRHLDLKRGFAILEDTKNGERRSIPLQSRALALLKQRAKVRHIETDLVFPSHTDLQQPIHLRKPWQTALERAEIEDFRWHDLRHSAASYLAMNGATLAEIAEILGHKTLAMVKRYAHLSDSHVASVVGRMNDQIFGSEV